MHKLVDLILRTCTIQCVEQKSVLGCVNFHWSDTHTHKLTSKSQVEKWQHMRGCRKNWDPVCQCFTHGKHSHIHVLNVKSISKNIHQYPALYWHKCSDFCGLVVSQTHPPFYFFPEGVKTGSSWFGPKMFLCPDVCKTNLMCCKMNLSL